MQAKTDPNNPNDKVNLHGVHTEDSAFAWQYAPEDEARFIDRVTQSARKGENIQHLSLGAYQADYHPLLLSKLATYDSSMLLAELRKIEQAVNVNTEAVDLILQIELVFEKILHPDVHALPDQLTKQDEYFQSVIGEMRAQFDQALVDFDQANDTPQDIINFAVALAVKYSAKSYAQSGKLEQERHSYFVHKADGTLVPVTNDQELEQLFGPQNQDFAKLFAHFATQNHFAKAIDAGVLFSERNYAIFSSDNEGRQATIYLPQNDIAYFQNIWYLPPEMEDGVEYFGRPPHSGVRSTLVRVRKVATKDPSVVDPDFEQFVIENVYGERVIIDPNKKLVYDLIRLENHFTGIVNYGSLVSNDRDAFIRVTKRFRDYGNHAGREFELQKFFEQLDLLPNNISNSEQYSLEERLNRQRGINLLRSHLPKFKAQLLLLMAYHDKAFAKKLFSTDETGNRHLLTTQFLAIVVRYCITRKLHGEFDPITFINKLTLRHIELQKPLQVLQGVVVNLRQRRWGVIEEELCDPEISRFVANYYIAGIRAITSATDAQKILSYVNIRDAIDTQTLQHLIVTAKAPEKMLKRVMSPSPIARFEDWRNRRRSFSPNVKQPASDYVESNEVEQLYVALLDCEQNFYRQFDGGTQSVSDLEKLTQFMQRLMHHVYYADYVDVLLNKAQLSSDAQSVLRNVVGDVQYLRNYQFKSDSKYRSKVQTWLRNVPAWRMNIALNGLRSDVLSGQIIGAVLSDSHLVPKLNMYTLYHFYQVAEDQVNSLLRKMSNRELKKEFKGWCDQHQVAFNISRLVEQLKENPGLWNTQFANSSPLRERLTAQHLFELLMSPNEGQHHKQILLDASLNAKLGELNVNQRIRILNHLQVAPTNNHESYAVLFTNVLTQADSTLKQAYFKKYFRNFVSDNADDATSLVNLYQSLLDSQGPFPSGLPLDQLFLEALSKRQTEARQYQKDSALVFVQCFSVRLLEEQDGVDAVFSIIENNDYTVAREFLLALLSDTQFVVDLVQNQQVFSDRLFRFLMEQMIEAPSVVGSILDEQQLANVMLLISTEERVRYFSEPKMADQLASAMLDNKKLSHLFDSIVGDDHPSVPMRAFVNHLDINNHYWLHFNAARSHLDALHTQLSARDPNKHDQLRAQLDGVDANIRFLKDVGQRYLKFENLVRAVLELHELQRENIFKMIYIEKARVSKNKRHLVPKLEKESESIEREINKLYYEILSEEQKLYRLIPEQPDQRLNHKAIAAQAKVRSVTIQYPVFTNVSSKVLTDGYLHMELPGLVASLVGFMVANGIAQAALDRSDIDLSSLVPSDPLQFAPLKQLLKQYQHIYSDQTTAHLVDVKLLDLEAASSLDQKTTLEINQIQKLQPHVFAFKFSLLASTQNFGSAVCEHLLSNRAIADLFFAHDSISDSALLQLITAFKQHATSAQLGQLLEMVIYRTLTDKSLATLVASNSAVIEEILENDSVSHGFVLNFAAMLSQQSQHVGELESQAWRSYLTRVLKAQQPLVPSWFMSPFYIEQLHRTVGVFGQWFVDAYLNGEFNGLTGFDTHALLNSVINERSFHPDQFLKALQLQNLAGSRHNVVFDFEGLIAKDKDLKTFVIAGATEHALIEMIKADHGLVPQQQVLYSALSQSPVIDAIIQKATVQDLKILADLDPKFATKISEHFVTNAQVRREVTKEWGITNGLLLKLLDHAGNFPKAVLLSDDAIKYLLNKDNGTLTKRFLADATNDQQVELMLYKDVRELVFDQQQVQSTPMVELLREKITNYQSFLQGETSKSHLIRLLPYLIQVHFVPGSNQGPSLTQESEAHRYLRLFMVTEDDAQFTPEFSELLHNANGRDLYEILKACRIHSDNTGHIYLENLARTLMRLMHQEGMSNNSQRYPELMDEMLMTCTPEEIIDILSNEVAFYEFVCDRIIAVCVDSKAGDRQYNAQLADHIKKTLQSNKITANDIVLFFNQTRQASAARLAPFFDPQELSAATSILSQQNVDEEKPAPWNLIAVLGEILNDRDGSYLQALSTDPGKKKLALEMLAQMGVDQEGRFYFTTHPQMIIPDNLSKILLPYLQTVQKQFVVSDDQYFVEFMKHFDPRVDHLAPVQHNTNVTGVQMVYHGADPNDSLPICEFHSAILKHAEEQLGMEKFWGLFIRKCDARNIKSDLIDRRERVSNLMSLIIGICCQDDKHFERAYTRRRGVLEQIDLTQAEVRTRGLRAVPDKSVAARSAKFGLFGTGSQDQAASIMNRRDSFDSDVVSEDEPDNPFQISTPATPPERMQRRQPPPQTPMSGDGGQRQPVPVGGLSK